MRMTRVLLLSFCLAGLPMGLSAQGTVAGVVLDAESGLPLPSAQIYIGGLDLGVLSSEDGRYSLQEVPAGTHTITAQRIGYATSTAEVVIDSGQTVALDLNLQPQALQLEGIVATGLVDPVEGVRSPITVGQVTPEIMPVVAAGAPLQNLQGRVAGVSIVRPSGQPGQDVQIQLRSPTSASSGVHQTGQPLIVVDGVILAEGSGTANIESMDIVNMEVIKGAAAASLYGSRAAAGVISITTNRGQNVAIGETRLSVRSELGVSQAYRLPELATHHPYLMDAQQAQYVDATGNPVDLRGRVTLPFSFADKPYPGTLFDNLNEIYRSGGFQQQTVSMAQNRAESNFALTVNRYQERGALKNNDGYDRVSVRMNADFRLGGSFTLGVSGYHSRDWRDEVNVSFTSIARAPVDVDLARRDENGEYIRVPDPLVAYENPIWRQASRENDRKRARTLGSVNLRWDPLNWLSFSASGSYDHQDGTTRFWLPKGTPLSPSRDIPSDGEILYDRSLDDAINAEAQMSLRRDFGALNARTTFRWLMERDVTELQTAEGLDFFVSGVPRIEAAQTTRGFSSEQEIRALGYLWDTALEYDEKYIATVLLRYDGSSLFGPEERWHTYYRGAFAYRLSEEEWFNIPSVDEFKLSYARGTAGGRPAFEHRFETWDVSASGVSKSTLGNRDLRPEHTLEQEISLDAIVFQDYGIRLTHAWQETTDQLVFRDLPTFTGYTNQWANGGTVTGYTTEVTLEAQLVETPDFSWTSTFVADRSNGKITEWPYNCFNLSFRFICEGVSIYALMSGPYVWDQSMLASHHGGKVAAAGRADEFMKNDDGLLVWVGPGGHYTDAGWGTSTIIEGLRYEWGMPFNWADEQGNRGRPQTIDASHTNLGWMNNFRIGRMSVFAHLNARIGGAAFNGLRRNLFRTSQDKVVDQTGKPEELKKPIEYYLAWSPFGDHFAQSTSFLKLRTLSVAYDMNSAQVDRLGLSSLGVSGLRLGLVGRDLMTFTGFSHQDPEAALNLITRQSAAGGIYPSTRTFTVEVQATF